MHLFLTSSPCNDDTPGGVELPCIFFEKNEFVERLRGCVKEESHFLVIPGDPENFPLNDEMARTFADCFEYHGMKIAGVEICDARAADRAEELVEWSDLILLGGGHVPTQNAYFERIGLKALLEGYEGVVMGVSAGSMNSAGVVYAQPELDGESVDPEYRRYISGLALTDVNILPHYQKARYMRVDDKWLYDEITYIDSIGREFLALPDGSYVLEENGEAWLYGEGYRVAGGECRRICEDGQSLRLK